MNGNLTNHGLELLEGETEMAAEEFTWDDLQQLLELAQYLP